MSVARKIAPAILVALLLAGCSGRSGSGPATNPAALVPSSVAKSTATLKIVIPAAKTAATSARKPAYVSPATQSIVISFTPTVGSPQTFNQNLTPASNPSCTASLISPEVCTVTFALAPGNYTATFATYDGLLDVNSNPTGNVLSQNQSIPVTIVGGQANSINVTLQGVPVTVAIIPGTSSTLIRTTTAGFTVSKCFASQTVNVIGIDAGGNYILGPGAPTPSLISSDTTQMAVTSPSTASPNGFTLTRPGIPIANATIMLTPTVTPGSGGGLAASASVAITFDATICGTFTEYTVPTSNSGIYGITLGQDNALWFTENINKIGRISASGSFTEYAVPTSSSVPSGIASGPDGALWFTEANGNKIGRITTGGSVTEYAVPSSSGEPNGIAQGSDGALWFTEYSYSVNKIGRISTSGAITEYAIPTLGSNSAGIVSGPDGALWFTEVHANQIGRISTSGSFNEYTIPTSNSSSESIASGPDGALWFTESNVDQIGRINTSGAISEYLIPTSSARPFGIVAGPDGALWFTEEQGNNIGRISTSGAITEYTIPTSSAQPFGITVGPDDALWFVETGGNKIGRLQ